MPKHVEYCRRPEYKAWKHEYDIQKAAEEFGEFGEAWRLLLDLEKEIRSVVEGRIPRRKRHAASRRD